MVNNVVLVGRITRDIELKSTNTGRDVVNFTVAVNRNFKNASGGYDADFINCIAFGQTATFMSNYLAKGRLVSVTGRIQTRNYDNSQGQRVYVTEVIADQVNGLDSRRDDNGFNNNQYNNSQPQQPTFNQSTGPESFMNNGNNSPFSVNNIGQDIDEDDLPF